MYNNIVLTGTYAYYVDLYLAMGLWRLYRVYSHI